MHILYVGYCDWPWQKWEMWWSYCYSIVSIWPDVVDCLWETLIYWWLEDGYTDNINDYSWSIGMRWPVIDLLRWWLPYQILWHGLILDVHDDCTETVGLLISCNCILVQMDEMLISSKWDYLLSSIRTCYCIHVIESY